MKGKHAKASANRQDRQALVDAAEQAKLGAARAEKERDEVLARTTRQVEAAQQEAATAKRLLAEGSSPEIERLRGEIERLRAERDAARDGEARIRDKWTKVTTRLIAFLAERLGISTNQAFELLHEAAGELVNVVSDSQLVVAARAGRITPEQAMAIERAKGRRTATDLNLDAGSASTPLGGAA